MIAAIKSAKIIAIKSVGRSVRKSKRVVECCPYCGEHHGTGSPWWNEAKGGWSVSYAVEKDGRMIQRNRLLTKGWEGHDEAIAEWKQAEFSAQPIDFTPPEPDGDQMLVKEVCALYLGKLEIAGQLDSLKRASFILQDFCKRPKVGLGEATVAMLRKPDGLDRIERWARSHSWSDGMLESAYKYVSAAFGFVAKRHHWQKGNPVAQLNKGSGKVKGRIREAVFSAEQVEAIIRNSGPEFSLAFRVLLATGCRPKEMIGLTADDVKKDAHSGDLYWWVNHKNQKHTGSKRRVYLTKAIQKLTRQAMADHPTGKIFRPKYAAAWTIDTLMHSMRSICRTDECKALGMDEGETRKDTAGLNRKSHRFVIYTCRHSFAYRWLTGFFKNSAGEPIIKSYGEVGQLMGDGAAQIERTYGHLVKATTFLQSRMDHA